MWRVVFEGLDYILWFHLRLIFFIEGVIGLGGSYTKVGVLDVDLYSLSVFPLFLL